MEEFTEFISFSGVFDGKYESLDKQESADDDEDAEIGGLFRAVSKQKSRTEKDSMDLMESSLSMPWSSSVQNFTDPQVIFFCYLCRLYLLLF